MISKKVLAVAGVAALLLTRRGRSGMTSAPALVQQGLRRRRARLPKGVEEFPPQFVDRRHTTGPTLHAAAGESATEVVAEHYQQQPSGS